jgi:hypothetical protein
VASCIQAPGTCVFVDGAVGTAAGFGEPSAAAIVTGQGGAIRRVIANHRWPLGLHRPGSAASFEGFA